LPNYVLRFRAPDRPGILARISSRLAEDGCDICEAHVFGDPDTTAFFVRMAIAAPAGGAMLADSIAPVADELSLDWELRDLGRRMRVLVAVSKFGHCLVDLVHKAEIGQLPVEIVGVVSNHEVMRKFVEWHGLAFHHLPMAEGKDAQEAAFLALFDATNADLLVLARYMQILSDDLSQQLSGRCINIHHSFLPSFKGAKPYHQAHARGVKIIGATAHYVTPDLDEGPIIEQDVRRVSHAVSADEMVATGREVEASVLSRAAAKRVRGFSSDTMLRMGLRLPS
jgi:formyltetrahydrofolate deformylase